MPLVFNLCSMSFFFDLVPHLSLPFAPFVSATTILRRNGTQCALQNGPVHAPYVQFPSSLICVRCLYSLIRSGFTVSIWGSVPARGSCLGKYSTPPPYPPFPYRQALQTTREGPHRRGQIGGPDAPRCIISTASSCDGHRTCSTCTAWKFQPVCVRCRSSPSRRFDEGM
jgi:hypothetical protein